MRLHLLPPYSPNDNAIERVWQDLHAGVTRNHTRRTLSWLLRDVRAWIRKRNASEAAARRRGGVTAGLRFRIVNGDLDGTTRVHDEFPLLMLTGLSNPITVCDAGNEIQDLPHGEGFREERRCPDFAYAPRINGACVARH